jgi:hypothetical protein
MEESRRQISSHTQGLVNLLPQVRAENLNKRDLQGGDLAVHEDTSQVQLHLEADVDISAASKQGQV